MIKPILVLLGAPAASTLSVKDKVQTVVAIFISIFILTLVTSWLTPGVEQLILVASMGASVMLVFIIPNSPLTQPYALLMGHAVSALVGVSCAYLGLKLQLPLTITAALCVSFSVLAMYLLNCIHPPGGAAALMPVIVGPEAVVGYSYVIYPVLLNTFLLIILGVAFHRWWLKKEYPSRPLPKHDPLHKHADASPLSRLGINTDDLESALGDFNSYLNISEKDLTEIYGYAQQKAYSRKFGEIRCADIMSKDVKSVEYATELEEAWALLRLHKVKLLPVVDNNNRVIGILSLVDYLKRANLKTYEGFAERLVSFVKRTPGLTSAKPENVGHIMAKPAFTVNENELIATLVPLLSDKGLHHIPVVNNEAKLVGIVTQSDLIAALYSRSVVSRSA